MLSVQCWLAPMESVNRAMLRHHLYGYPMGPHIWRCIIAYDSQTTGTIRFQTPSRCVPIVTGRHTMDN
jgi:hypothetical protein